MVPVSREWLPPSSWVYKTRSLLIDDTPGIPPGGLWVKNYIWRKQCLLGRWQGHKPSKTGRLIYVMIMGMLISKGKAIHPKFHPPGSPHLTQWGQPLHNGCSHGPGLLQAISHLILPKGQRAMYLLGCSVYTGGNRSQKRSKDLPKVTNSVQLFTSTSGPIGSVHSMCLMPKPMLFSPVPLSCNNHAGKCLFHPKATNDTTLSFFFFNSNLSLQGSRIVNAILLPSEKELCFTQVNTGSY